MFLPHLNRTFLVLLLIFCSNQLESWTFCYIMIYYAINSHFSATSSLFEIYRKQCIIRRKFMKIWTFFQYDFLVYSLVTRQNIQQCTFTRSTCKRFKCILFIWIHLVFQRSFLSGFFAYLDPWWRSIPSNGIDRWFFSRCLFHLKWREKGKLINKIILMFCGAQNGTELGLNLNHVWATSLLN